MKHKWVKIDIPVLEGDFVRPIKVEGKAFTLVREKKQYYLFQAKCPHAGAILGNGWCEKGQLICPVHRYAYDLESGRGAFGQGDYLKVHPIELRSDGLYIGLRRNFWSLIFD